MKSNNRRRAGVGVAALFSLAAARVLAQAPAAPPLVPMAPAAAPTPADPNALAPPTLPPPAFPTPVGPPARTLTLDQVLALALNNNSSVRLGREKVIKAQQLIYEANASGLPQIRVDVVDTYSSNKTFGTASGGSNSTGTLPGGGAIPVIVDTGGGNATSVTGSGGGGTATGAGSSSLTTVSTTSGSTGGSGATTNTTAAGNTTGTIGTGSTGTGTTGTGATGTGTTGTGTGGNFGTTGPTTNAMSTSHLRSQETEGNDLPPLMQQYVSATKGEANTTRSASSAAPRDTTTGTGTGTGTGTEPGNGSFNTGNGGFNNNYSARLSITQGIDLFQLVPAAQDVERITRDFYVTDLERVQNETALSVKDQFFNVLRDQAQVGVYQEQVAANTESVRVTQARVTAGAAAQYDLLTAQTTLSNSQQQLSSARNALALALVNLNNLIGLSPTDQIALQTPALPALNQTFNAPGLTQTALTRRPEIIQSNNNVVIAQRLIKLAGSSLLPSLSIVAGGNYNGHVSGSSSNSTFNLSAVLGIPLYDGGSTKAKVAEAQSDLRSQLITRDQLRENVSVEVLQALSNLNDAQTRAASAGVGADTAAEALRLANVRYQNGIGTILDVENAQAQLATARLNLLNAQYDYQTSQAQLTRAIGGR